MAKAERPAPVRINTLDLTLDELDAARELEETGECRRMAALAVVWCRSHRTRFGELTVDQAKRLTLRDVRVVEDEAGDDDPADPTGARS